MKAFLTCEHAGYEIDDWLCGELNIPDEILKSHQGWDPGALKVATVLQKKLQIPLWSVKTTRLLVEPNRSVDHPCFFSKYSKDLSSEAKAKALNWIYHPFRKKIRDWIQTQPSKEKIAHFSIHSFTPVLNGSVRNAEIGILYDPQSMLEKDLSQVLYQFLRDKGWKVRKNYPYQGISDGHTKALRRLYGNRYAGFEIEINQQFFEGQPHLAHKGRRLSEDLTSVIQEVLKAYP